MSQSFPLMHCIESILNIFICLHWILGYPRFAANGNPLFRRTSEVIPTAQTFSTVKFTIREDSKRSHPSWEDSDRIAPSLDAPHRDYGRRKKELEPIFSEDFPNIALLRQDMGKVGHETQIPQSTLYPSD
jgi:hypothetical protein